MEQQGWNIRAKDKGSVVNQTKNLFMEITESVWADKNPTYRSSQFNEPRLPQRSQSPWAVIAGLKALLGLWHAGALSRIISKVLMVLGGLFRIKPVSFLERAKILANCRHGLLLPPSKAGS